MLELRPKHTIPLEVRQKNLVEYEGRKKEVLEELKSLQEKRYLSLTEKEMIRFSQLEEELDLLRLRIKDTHKKIKDWSRAHIYSHRWKNMVHEQSITQQDARP
jgi:hypothetical protein